MNVNNLPRANEIYDLIRDLQGKLEHMKNAGVIIKVISPMNSKNNRLSDILIREFKFGDVTFDHVLMSLHDEYVDKINELKEEFRQLD